MHVRSHIRFIALALVGLALTLAPVSAQDATPPADESFWPTCAAAHPDATPEAEMSEEGAELPEWQTTELTDVRSGETYTIADLKGCVVYVETMATWCPSCRQQLTNVMTALPDIDRERVVIVAISVETDLDPPTLASYAEQNTFDFVFSVASEDMLKSIVDEFGREAIVPPATPHFIVRADGSFTDLKTGFVDPADIVANIDAQLNPADGE